MILYLHDYVIQVQLEINGTSVIKLLESKNIFCKDEVHLYKIKSVYWYQKLQVELLRWQSYGQLSLYCPEMRIKAVLNFTIISINITFLVLNQPN